ncbi:HAD-IA family hydrolase [Streptomyces sp. BA2]|nr:HAD-IA family hydrolase [Streptomyces sp. BA2]
MDAEQSGHLRAFNQMWAELGVPWQWTAGQYAHKLRISGGTERLASLYHDADFRARVSPPLSWEAWMLTVRTWHRHKTRVYLALLDAGAVQARPGVRRLAAEAADAGWRLAVASSGAKESVSAALRMAVGADLAAAFTVVSGAQVSRKKPDPEVYRYAAQSVGVAAYDCVAVEGTRNGILAALAARMHCLVTPTRVSAEHDFTGASRVVTHLGDPHREPAPDLSTPAAPHTAPPVVLADLQQLILDGPRGISSPACRPARCRPGRPPTAPDKEAHPMTTDETTPARHSVAVGPAGPAAFALLPDGSPQWTPDAVLFDCDGTLMDTEPCWSTALAELFARNGVPWRPEDKPHYIGGTVRAMADRAADAFGDPGRADVLEKELLDLVVEAVDHSAATPLPGALELFTALSSLVPTAVVSNSPRRVLDIALERGGLSPLVRFTVAAEDPPRPKPAPDPYLMACAHFGVNASRCLAVEDSLTGLTSARAAGLVTVGVPTLPDPAFPADLLLDSLQNPGLVRWATAWSG